MMDGHYAQLPASLPSLPSLDSFSTSQRTKTNGLTHLFLFLFTGGDVARQDFVDACVSVLGREGAGAFVCLTRRVCRAKEAGVGAHRGMCVQEGGNSSE
jgi:hypothetical protein